MNKPTVKIRRRRLTRFIGATNRRSGHCLSSWLVTLKLIRAACKISHLSSGIRASLTIDRYLFAVPFRRFYLPQTIARCARLQCRRIAESSFNNFMANQQLPFR